MKVLTRHGALIEEEGMSYLAEMETDAALAPLQSAACTYRIAQYAQTQVVITPLPSNLSAVSRQMPVSKVKVVNDDNKNIYLL